MSGPWDNYAASPQGAVPSTAGAGVGPWSNYSSSSAPAAPAPAPPETAGRVAGLGARALLTGAAGMLGSTDSLISRGVGAVPGVLSDVEHGNLKQAGHDVAGVFTAPQPYNGPELSDLVHPSRWGDAAQYFANKAGLPSPVTPNEKIASAAVGALPAIATMPEDPEDAAVAAKPLLKAWQLAKTGGLLAASGAAPEFVKTQGGSPGEQLAAGLAVGALPMVAAGGAGLVRSLTRGAGADAVEAAARRMTDATTAGTRLTAGQVTGSRALNMAEGASARLWGSGPLLELLNAQDAHAGNTVRQLADDLSAGEDATPTTAGEAITAGINASKAASRVEEDNAYNRVAQLVPPETQVNLSGTRGVLDRLATPTPGAEATTGALISPNILRLRDNLAADAGPTGALPYSAARALRTHLRNNIDWGFAPADTVKTGALKQVYGALTGDLNAAASGVSPEAAQAVSTADSLYRANKLQGEALNNLIDRHGGPEAIYNAALSGTKSGATRIRSVMAALPDSEQRNLVRATVLGKMGLVPASGQNAAGDVFQLNSFLTRWNQMSPEAKDTLFPHYGEAASTRKAIDSVARTAENVRASALLKNPSGTAGAYMHTNTLWDLMETVGGGSVGALVDHHGLAGVGSAVLGASAGYGANVGLSRLMTAKWFADWLAHSTKLSPSALPAAIASLQRIAVTRKSQSGLNVAHALASGLAQTGR